MPAIRPINPNAARLRRDATEAEKQLWAVVRNRQLDGWKFRRPATIGPFVVDFLCAEKCLIVELDGGQHSEDVDRARTAYLNRAGYVVLRFWNNEVADSLEGVADAIRVKLAELPALRDIPSPNPLPQAGEGF